MPNSKAIVIVGTQRNFHFLQEYLFKQNLRWWATKDTNEEYFSDNYDAIMVREFLEGEGLEMALCDSKKITSKSMEFRNVEHKLEFDNDEDKKLIVEWIEEHS